ncbi:MAG: hypothetical protein HY332_02720 [Chloroflexi bacterium]|nr:hypothetical protein [Chloroflexota bacterium]
MRRGRRAAMIDPPETESTTASPLSPEDTLVDASVAVKWLLRSPAAALPVLRRLTIGHP